MRFVVTGGSGFIGHNVVKMLTDLGHDCFVIDNATDYGFIPGDELKYLHNERHARMRSGCHRVSLTDYKNVSTFMSNFAALTDCVIHLASFPRQKVVNNNPVAASEVMSTGLVNLLELTKSYRIPKFVYISSSMVYGDFEDGVKEDAVCKPQGQYGIMKLLGEDLVRDYHRRGCFDYNIIRPSAVYGELDVEDRVVSKFMLAAIRGETLKVNGADERLDFTHVSDTAAGIVGAVLSKNATNKTYNITRSQSHSLLEAAQLACKIAGSGKLVVGNRDMSFPSRGALNIDAARNDFGYNPTVDLEQGLERYYEWFKSSTFWAARNEND